MGSRPPPPAERVREKLRLFAGDRVAREMPSGYQRLGHVLVLRLPSRLRPYYPALGLAWQEELGVSTVLVRTGPIDGELRTPTVERIAGGPTETEVVEHGIRWRFDAASIMFAAGNRTERRRAGRLVDPGESVVDLFAGIGYFAIPAAVHGAREVFAVDKNPVAIRYLVENARRNRVADRVRPIEGDNRAVELPRGAADRVFLGYLPSALPWVGRAVELVRPGGWIHVHLVLDARHARSHAEREVERALADVGAAAAEPPHARRVKPYGPGRTHVVVDAKIGARPRA